MWCGAERPIRNTTELVLVLVVERALELLLGDIGEGLVLCEREDVRLGRTEAEEEALVAVRGAAGRCGGRAGRRLGRRWSRRARRSRSDAVDRWLTCTQEFIGPVLETKETDQIMATA
jgi:hypothetical protein